MSQRVDKGRFVLHVIKQQRKNFLKPRRYPIKIWKIVRGDTVFIRNGEDRGKTGVVRLVNRKRNTVLVDGVNFVKKAVKGSDTTKSGVFLMEAPLNVASVMLIDPTDGKPCRVGFRFLEDGSKVRVSKRTGAVIPKPEVLKQRKRPKPEFNPEKDTPAEAVLKQTYVPPSFLRRAAEGAPIATTTAANSFALLLLSAPLGFL